MDRWLPGREDSAGLGGAGGSWVHLRLCRACGHVGCCDQSPNQHASKHFQAAQHPIIQSFEKGEDWIWCYIDEVYLEPT
ncbi:MAG: UBP-type zinc finger domain-containing protein [Chloroflexi bacterium]|nr:MAG: UBP-type zinc finger domain-containing protein [Chloroflexota bacterium]